MAYLRLSDLRAVLRCAWEIGEVGEAARFPDRMLSSLHELIPSDALCYDEISRSGTKIATFHLPTDAVPAQEEAACRLFSHQNPVVSHLLRTRDPRPLRASDFLSQREFAELDVYHACYRPLGWEYQLMVLLPSRAPILRGLAFNRRARDYSERDVAVAELVRPHLASAYRRAQSRSRLRGILSSLVHAVDGRDEGVVLHDGDRRVTFATPRASSWLSFYFGWSSEGGTLLPDALARFVRRHSAHREGEKLPLLDDVQVFPKEDRRLVVQFLPHGENDGDDALLLKEQRDQAPAVALKAGGLTRREIEVLGLTAEGKTNEEIANLLFVSSRTVDKHLEHIYQKLAVHSRTAAVRALTRPPNGW